MAHSLSNIIQHWKLLIKEDFEILGYLSLDNKNLLISEIQDLGFEVSLGTTRIAILQKQWVVKLPVNSQGFAANYNEATSPWCPIARNKLFGDVLVMERVEPISLSWKTLPDWCSFVDCCQVGYTRKGKLVAYDL